ncbi:hypothetical protein [Devosia sp. LC5]|uniref:hypothetical protein n=1 Tax=Devosia sp. LC5 TaxID=1502724 RepID=UPI00055517AE|nr:hypothetical protein [Devosia sp. LC5]
MFSFWGKIKAGLAIAGAIIFAIGVAFLRGRAEGKKIIEAEQAKRRAESMKQRKEIGDEVDQMGAADVDSNYSRWLRDD